VQAVFAVVIGPVRVSPTDRNISVDPLATHLIINRRLPPLLRCRGVGMVGRCGAWLKW
jgi:hypothetical protein